MNIIRNNKQGLVVGETPLCYRVKPVATKTVLWPKQYCRIDHPYYDNQLAMHLIAGYGITNSSIDTVAKLSAFVPALILAARKLDAQLQLGSRVWNKVFCYDIAQAAGSWLAANPHATVADFTAKLEELIA
jgi:hypothetical protein